MMVPIAQSTALIDIGRDGQSYTVINEIQISLMSHNVGFKMPCISTARQCTTSLFDAMLTVRLSVLGAGGAGRSGARSR